MLRGLCSHPLLTRLGELPPHPQEGLGGVPGLGTFAESKGWSSGGLGLGSHPENGDTVHWVCFRVRAHRHHQATPN